MSPSHPAPPDSTDPPAPPGGGEGLRFDGARVGVVGLGKSGLAAAELLARRGARVVAFDEQASVPEAPRLRELGVALHTGGLPAGWSDDLALAVVSPGVPLAKPELRAARARGVPLIAEVELAARCLPPGAGPILGVTGTNGKSTTTALLGGLVAEGGRRTFVGGNLGRPFSEACAARYDAHVVELSSFQLEGVERLGCLGAAVLNLTPDHLDRYPDAAAYGAAKARIFERQPAQGFAVVNADDPAVCALACGASVPVYGFTRSPGRVGAPRLVPGEARTFGGFAVAVDGGFELTFGDRERFTLANRALRGAHNLENAMAAALLARLAGVGAEAIARGLDAFPGLAHRMESVRELDGVEWINDSKATNVDSSLVALRALPGRVWLIAGGKGKGAPYAPLVEVAVGRALGVLTIGQDAPTIAAAFAAAVPVHPCGTLAEAVATARRLARPGDVVLLSPACASYDQFRHFEHRGDTFKQLVRAL